MNHLRWLYVLFFLSGFPALLYQIVWQRALFTVFGVNVESVTVVVCAFMLGLGCGSLLGGRLSRNPRIPALYAFAVLELGIAAYGSLSLHLFQFASAAGPIETFVKAFALVLIPTTLMGATLPLLTAELVRRNGHVGQSVGMLYFVNTLGSAAACFAAALYLMRHFGMNGTISLAAGMNSVIACAVLLLHRHSEHSPPTEQPPSRASIKFLALSAIVGFVSLGHEILWYRVYSFITGGSPQSFACVLGAFLTGIALGSLAARRMPETALAKLLIAANALAFLSTPLIAQAVQHTGYAKTLPVIAVTAALLGAAFPLLCHAAIAADANAGTGLSYMYMANIAGSTLGSYAIGFVALDRMPLHHIAILLTLFGMLAALWLAPRTPWIVAAAVVFLPVYGQLYERLMLQEDFDPTYKFTDIVETRSGVVTVDDERHIYGGGAHDGVLTTSLAIDSCVRPYSLSYFHPNPREVLLIGVAGGAWTEIVGRHPSLERAVAVEINPGYLEVISRHPEVAGLLKNPKVQVVADDARRWMNRNKHQRFDAILMDTVQHWRSNATNLLSTEMLTLTRGMLKPGGMFYYNTTYSDDAIKTGATIFPHALRFGPFLAVSESPLQLDEARWRAIVEKQSGAPKERLDEIAKYFQTVDETGAEHFAVESRDSILRRTKRFRVITDDNMASEWK